MRCTCEILEKAGYHINKQKSNLIPTQRVEFLGFVLDAVKMTVLLPAEKRRKIEKACKELMHTPTRPIRVVARTIGVLVATFPVVPYRPSRYRCLEREKTLALKENKGNYSRPMTVKDGCSYEQLQWWTENVSKESTAYPIVLKCTTAQVMSDASFSGWGGAAKLSEGPELTAAGQWAREERESKNINYLEMKAALYTLQALCKECRDAVLSLKVDNTATVRAIRNMGSRQ